MGERLICRKCRNGLYIYSEPDREDWENREMKCETCGHTDTLKKMTDDFYASIEKDKKHKIINLILRIIKSIHLVFSVVVTVVIIYIKRRTRRKGSSLKSRGKLK